MGLWGGVHLIMRTVVKLLSQATFNMRSQNCTRGDQYETLNPGGYFCWVRCNAANN